MPDARRFALPLLIALAAASPALAGNKPPCWSVPELPEHVARWNGAINRDRQGQPLSPDYDIAAQLLALHMPRLATRRLEKVIRDTRPELDGTGLPEDAAAVAGLIAACPAWRIDREPIPTRVRPRRLPSAAARVILIRPRDAASR